MNLPPRICVVVQDKPIPRGPVGQSALIKWRDWMEIRNALAPILAIDIVSSSDLGSSRPNVVEAFFTALHTLTPETFPTLEEHHSVSFFSKYWPSIVRSEVPAIPVIENEPKNFPVFVRGELGTFPGGGRVNSRAALARLRNTGRRLIVRPHVNIRNAETRKEVTLELRAHVVCGKVAAVEYLFPHWAVQSPTQGELDSGHLWTESVTPEVLSCVAKIGNELLCRWYVADFAETDEGLRLIELNPGWCSGIAHKETARAVHLSILKNAFGLPLDFALYPKPGPGVSFVNTD
jgi:hypothetical protein